MSDNQLLSVLQSGTTQDKIDALQEVLFEKLEDAVLEEVANYLVDEDKGIRNSVQNILINNPSSANYIVKYISSDDISVRNLAGEVLVRIGNESVESLVKYLSDSDDYDDQKFIIDVLGLIGDPSVSPKVIEELKKNTDDNVKLACIETLGNLRDASSVEELMAAYRQNELFKPSVIEALGKIGSTEAAGFMETVYAEEDVLTKYSIIESLGLIGNENTFFFLISQLNETSGPLVWPIIKSIQQLKEQYNLEVPFDEKIKSVILDTIYEAQPEFKKAAIFLLSQFNDKEMISAFLNSVGEDEELDIMIRGTLLENVEKTLSVYPSLLQNEIKNATPVLETLVDLLQNSETPLEKIYNGLSLRSLIDSLSKYLTHPDEEARRLAMILLFGIDAKAAILFADKMVNDDNIWNKLKLIENLAELDDEGVTPILEKLAEDSEIMVSKRASDLLNQRSSIYN